jgi:hypothetical protein
LLSAYLKSGGRIPYNLSNDHRVCSVFRPRQYIHFEYFFVQIGFLPHTFAKSNSPYSRNHAMRETKNLKTNKMESVGVSKMQIRKLHSGQIARKEPRALDKPAKNSVEMLEVTGFLEAFTSEVDAALELSTPNPYLNMATHLIRNHLEGKTVTASALVAASGVPYATGTRKLSDMVNCGLVEQRPRTKTGKSFSLHPSAALLHSWSQVADRIKRLAKVSFRDDAPSRAEADYYFGGTYMSGQTIPPLQVLSEPLSLAGGLRILVHGDPTFMVMSNLKRQFEQVVGTKISQRAFSIDRLHEEILRNAERKVSRYDIVAIDLPWIGEFVEKNILLPLEEVLDVERLDPADFHTAGWRAAHWAGKPYAVPLPPRLVCRGRAGAARHDRRTAEGGAIPARSGARPLRHRLECGARHAAGTHVHHDLRRFWPAGSEPAPGRGRL